MEKVEKGWWVKSFEEIDAKLAETKRPQKTNTKKKVKQQKQDDRAKQMIEDIAIRGNEKAFQQLGIKIINVNTVEIPVHWKVYRQYRSDICPELWIHDTKTNENVVFLWFDVAMKIDHDDRFWYWESANVFEPEKKHSLVKFPKKWTLRRNSMDRIDRIHDEEGTCRFIIHPETGSIYRNSLEYHSNVVTHGGLQSLFAGLICNCN